MYDRASTTDNLAHRMGGDVTDGAVDPAATGRAIWGEPGPLPALATRRMALSKLLDVRAILSPHTPEYDLCCREYHRALDGYTAALMEAAPPDFVDVTVFLIGLDEHHPDRPWLRLAAGDWLIGPAEARRRLALLDQEANRQMFHGVRGGEHVGHRADGGA